jgi:phage anti-repressor protein
MQLIKSENRNLISAKELHKELGMKRIYSTWIKDSIERAYLEVNKDFLTHTLESTGGRPSIDYLITKESAIQIIIMSGGQFAKELRKKVVELYNQHDTGLAFTAQQIEALMDLSRAMTLVSIQKEVEKKHFDIFNDKYTWYQYRAALLGYSTNDVIEAMRKVNKKHHSIRASLVQLDSNELIRTGVIDFMIAMGKTSEYATNVGNLCKSISAKMQLGNIIWDDTKDNPLQINQSDVLERQNNYTQVKKLL